MTEGVTRNRRTSSGLGILIDRGGASGYFIGRLRKTFPASARSSTACARAALDRPVELAERLGMEDFLALGRGLEPT